AVTLVVLFHLWPHRFTGGYVGVDAFFVISGYLITSHLLREVDATGRLNLLAFYARRARRLLPASFAVLLSCLATAVVLLPVELRAANAKEILASAFYVQNFYLATKAVTYSASNDVASSVQHFWSLSAEEQFYLVWPGLIIASLFVARRWVRRRTTTTIGVSLVALTAVSFGFSVWFTDTNPSAAYFVTPTRAWEFGMGALVVLAQRRWSVASGVRFGLRWAGLVGLVVAGLTFTQSTAFPGYAAALPCLATAAVIVAEDTGTRDPLSRLVGARPTQWLGNISYSVYLVHWPLIVFTPYVLGGTLTWTSKLGVIAITLLLADLSKRYIEDAARHVPALVRSPRRALVAALAGMLVIGAGVGGSLADVQHQEDQIAVAIARGAPAPCYGAAALATRLGCPHAVTADAASPVVKADAPWSDFPGCHVVPGTPLTVRCRWGSGKPAKTVALIGDSHAEHWRIAVATIARKRNWELIEMYLGGCAANYAPTVGFEGRPQAPERCLNWSHRVSAHLQEFHPSLVLTTAFVRATQWAPATAGPQGFLDIWRDWQKFATVEVLADVPGTGGKNGPQCLAIHAGDPLACATDRATALPDDALDQAVRLSARSAHPVRFVDLSRYFCDRATCYAVVGSVPVYFDNDHLTRRFVVTLAPYLEAALS
ncbi:MAG TPA: acyltransferase family protein, partial [Pedococcus sp.]|nr:acyltransferase family protein [Pedococcus sp.]